MAEAMLNELRQEAVITKRLLDRVPEDKLEWRPHPKSMSLGQLALHVASIPGDLTRLAQLDQFDAANANFEPAMPESKSDGHERIEQGTLRSVGVSSVTFAGCRSSAVAAYTPWGRGLLDAARGDAA